MKCEGTGKEEEGLSSDGVEEAEDEDVAEEGTKDEDEAESVLSTEVVPILATVPGSLLMRR